MVVPRRRAALVRLRLGPIEKRSAKLCESVRDNEHSAECSRIAAGRRPDPPIAREAQTTESVRVAGQSHRTVFVGCHCAVRNSKLFVLNSEDRAVPRQKKPQKEKSDRAGRAPHTSHKISHMLEESI